MKLPEESCSTVSTDLSVSEKNQNNDVSISSIFKDRTKCKVRKESKELLWKCRYTIVLLSFFANFYLNCLRLNISINIIAMVNSSILKDEETVKTVSCQSIAGNVTENGKRFKMLSKEGEFDWSPKIQGYILGSYFFGHVSSSLPAGLLAERYGCKLFMILSILVPAVCTLLIPFFSNISVFIIIVLQVLRGAFQGLTLPALVVLSANWYPKIERGFFTSLAISGGPFGCCLGSMLSGFLCESAGGWPASFYAFGASGCFIAVLVFFFMAENPNVHSTISKAELNFILNNQENALLKRRPKLPWRKILTSVPVYALAFAYFGQLWALAQFWSIHSTFLATIHHYHIRENGLLSAAPFALQFLFVQSASWISLLVQKKKMCGINFLRKFMNFAACLGVSFCLLGMYFSGCNSTWSVVFAMLSAGCAGIAYAGCWVVCVDMCPTFAGTVHAICLTVGLTATCLVPIVAGYLTDEMQTIEQWNKVFFLSIGVVMSSGIVFAVFGSADVQPWNFVEEKSAEKDKQLGNNVTEEMGNNKCEEQTRF